MNIIYTLFGEGDELNSLQLSFRAFVLFFIALALLRISGIRTFGKKSPFDTIIAIMLGAVLSRAVVGASPIVPTVCGSFILVLLHRILGWLSIYVKALSKVVKGQETLLFKNGQMINENLKKNQLTDGDIMESVRLNTNLNSLDNVDEIIMERSGRISVILKNKNHSK